MFIHTRPGGSNDITHLTCKVIYSTLVSHSSKSPDMTSQSCVSQTFNSASRPARSSVDEGSNLTPQRRHMSTHHEQASQRRADDRTNDTRSTAASVIQTVSVQITLPATLTRCNIASVGAGMSHSNAQFTSCYAMPEQFYSCAIRRTYLLFSTG